MFSGVLSRQKDGIFRQIELNEGAAAGTYVKVNGGLVYTQRYLHREGDQTLSICELEDAEQVSSNVFNRLLPMAFSHTLMYGDVLFVLQENGRPKDFTLQDIYLVMKGSHPFWSNANDIQVEENANPSESDSEVDFEDDDDELTLRTEHTNRTAKTVSEDEEDEDEDEFSNSDVEEEEEDDDDEKVDNADDYYEVE